MTVANTMSPPSGGIYGIPAGGETITLHPSTVIPTTLANLARNPLNVENCQTVSVFVELDLQSLTVYKLFYSYLDPLGVSFVPIMWHYDTGNDWFEFTNGQLSVIYQLTAGDAGIGSTPSFMIVVPTLGASFISFSQDADGVATDSTVEVTAIRGYSAHQTLRQEISGA